jgi:hypothetical protein
LPSVLERLESYAWCERGHKTVGEQGRVRLAGRPVYIDPRLAGQKIQLYETLEGMEARDGAGKNYLLRNYRNELCVPLWKAKDQTRPYYFTRIYYSRRAELPSVLGKKEEAVQSAEGYQLAAHGSPRIAVAYSQ